MSARRVVRPLLGLFVLAASAPTAAAQTTYSWTGNVGEIGPGLWLNPVNWTGGPAGRRPGATAAGLASDGTAADTALFTTFPGGASSGCGIDFGTAGGSLSVGAISFKSRNASGIYVGNTSTTTAGVLRLNGATVTSQLVGTVSNVVFADTEFSYGVYGIAPLPNRGTGGPGLTLQLGTPDAVFLTDSSILDINVPISEAAPGYGVTIRASGSEVIFRRPNTFSGPTRIAGGVLNINQDAALGVPPSGPTPNRIVIGPDPVNGAPGVLSTNAATFEINANRGIAVGPATGTGDGEINVPDPTVQGYTATITYNGVIANNGSGTGRLVFSGGGLLILGGSNTFTGGTLHHGGELRLTSVNALGPAGMPVTITPQGFNEIGYPYPGNLMVQATGTFAHPIVVDYTGSTTRPVTIGTPDFAAAGSETLFAGTVTLNRPATFQGGNDFRTRFTGPITGTGAVTVTGTAAGRVVAFDGSTGNAFTYTGGTTVVSGTLLAVGQGPTMSATGSGAVAVTGGTLGGTGRIAGAVSATGGRVAPGTASTTGVLTVGGGVAFNNVATFAARLNGTTAGTNYDQLRVEGGNVALGGAGLSLALGYTPAPTDVLVILRNDGLGRTTGQFAGFAPGSPVTVGSSTAYVYYDYDAATGLFGPGNDVAITFSPVPEPAAVLGLAAGVLGLAGRGRRG
jgi:fibronectin-binding autotransporter adhesin